MHRIKKEAIFVIDASYLMYRSYYAIKPLYASDGTPTQATYGFFRAFKKLMDDFNPANIIVAWDSKGPTFRNEMYTQYKATRSAPPSDLFAQKEYIQKILDAMGVCQMAKLGYEADDVIAAIAQKFRTDYQIVLVCPDKDMYQLMGSNLLVFDPFKSRLFDQAEYEQELGFPTEKLPFYYALLGDASDNIPGVHGIGKKGALDLVVQFDSLDDLYKNIDKVEKERTRKSLLEHKDDAYLSYQLFLLKPFELEVPQNCMQFNHEQWHQAAALFTQLEFFSFVKKPAVQKSIFDAVTQPSTELSDDVTQNESIGQKLIAKPWECIIIETEQSLQQLIDDITETGYCALDTETNGINPVGCELVGISFAINITQAYYIPFLHPTTFEHQQLNRAHTLAQLKTLLENPNIYKYMHNAKFDEIVFRNYDIVVDGTTFDTILAANLFRSDDEKINLKDLSAQYLHEPMQKFKDVMGKQYKSFEQVPLAQAAPYGAYDSLQTLKLKEILENKLEQEPILKKFFHDVEMPFYKVLLKMEYTGITLDPQILKETSHQTTLKLITIKEKIEAAIGSNKINGHEINLNSPNQVEALLFDQLNLPPVKKSPKGKRSTDREVLDELSKIHPIPGLIIQYRELTKLQNTYLEPLPTFINQKTGRVHTSYSQTMVTTGRLSSSNPNLQNIPTTEGFGIAVRSAFIAPPGRHFISADYSQVELRILAHLSQDENLKNIFLHNQDIHTQTAAQLFGIPLDQVGSEERKLGKRINFSITYGLTPYGLAQDLGISPKQAKEYIDRYFATYPGIQTWMEKTVEFAKEHGYIETLMGRRRYIPLIHEKNKTLFDAGRRMAINSPVQGTQAELMKVAMTHLNTIFEQKKVNAQLILQIHDEVLIEVNDNELEQTQGLIQATFESVVDWDIPLKVTLRSGKDWGEVTK